MHVYNNENKGGWRRAMMHEEANLQIWEIICLSLLYKHSRMVMIARIWALNFWNSF